MQPTEGFTIPRRTLDIEDYIDIVRRHRGWIFGPFLFTLVASVVGVYLYPDSYESDAVIMIEPQKVPENFVPAAINQEMMQRIQAIAEQIESRTVLTTIIQTFGLYKREQARMPFQDVIEEMKNAISIVPVATVGSAQRAPAFAIQFKYENRLLAQKVNEDIVRRFIDASETNRENATVGTVQFMKDQTQQAQKQLDEIEDRLTQFRISNNGRLPDQMEANRQQFMQLETSANYTQQQYDRAVSDRLTMESNLNILRDRLVTYTKEPEPVNTVPAKSQKLLDQERIVDEIQTKLNALLQEYQPTFPDVITEQGLLEQAKKKRDQIAKDDEDARKATPSVKRADPQLQSAILNTNEQIKALQSAIENKTNEINQLSKDLQQKSQDMKASTDRLAATPLNQKEYDDLMRDRELAKTHYESAAAKLAAAQTSQDMEKNQQGESLSILDPASLPVKPSEPKRPLDISIGAGLGLLLGIVIAGAREMKDTSLKNLKDVRAYTKMSILGSIPLLENDFVVRRRRRLAWLGWTTACLAAAVVISGSIVYYYATKQ